MTTITNLSQTLQTLLTTTADQLAKQTGFIRRQREVTGAGFAQALVLGGLAQPNATRKQLHHQAGQAGLRLSLQGFDQRLNGQGVVFMRSLLETTLTQMVQSDDPLVVLPQFKGVYVTDCTRLVWGQTGDKLAVRWEIQHGQLQAGLMPLTQHDQKAGVVDQSMPPGALHLGDLGFFNLQRFRRWSAQGVYWLTRYKIGTRLFTLEGQPLDLKSLLTGDEPISLTVQVGCGRPALVAELRAARLSDEALSKRLARLNEQARLDQRPLSQRQLDLMGWTLYLTNIPDLTFEQAHILARTRWQIELLFKLWKSHGQVLNSRSANPERQACEGYAKLIAVMIAHWLLLVAGWQHDRLSAIDALRILRTHISLLQRALLYLATFDEVFHWLRLDLDLAPRRARRRTAPLAFQLWDDFEASYA